MEVARDKDEGFEALLLRLRHRLRRRAGVIGYCVMQLTNSSNPELEAKLRQSARPETLMMGKVNQERLAEYLGELKRKEDTNDRYVAALKGETLTRNPYVRIQPVPNPSGSEVKK
ncbi:hypothetical protein DH2020_041700 [Rehmannia glutinosa]|uniref:Uncharacterized protein n=1 Tax=Rehmannia glutinosa TaxID=99300 RepID=A0ABR0UQF0_REHGL